MNSHPRLGPPLEHSPLTSWVYTSFWALIRREFRAHHVDNLRSVEQSRHLAVNAE